MMLVTRIKETTAVHDQRFRISRQPTIRTDRPMPECQPSRNENVSRDETSTDVDVRIQA